MEESGPTILYQPNVIADTFSRLLNHDVSPIPVGENVPVVLFDFTSKSLNINNDPDLTECFLNLPLLDVVEYKPVELKRIQTQQDIGTEHSIKAVKHLKQYFNKVIDGPAIVAMSFLMNTA